MERDRTDENRMLLERTEEKRMEQGRTEEKRWSGTGLMRTGWKLDRTDENRMVQV